MTHSPDGKVVELCHRCKEREAQVNDGDDALGPGVCDGCYDPEWKETPMREPTPELLAELRRFYENSPNWAAEKIPALLDHIETLTAERDAERARTNDALSGEAHITREYDDAIAEVGRLSAELAAERGRREEVEYELNEVAAAHDRFQDAAIAAEAELAAERGRREAAEAQLAQVMAALEKARTQVAIWGQCNVCTDVCKGCLDAFFRATRAIDRAIAQQEGAASVRTSSSDRSGDAAHGDTAEADAVPSCGGERVALLERIAKAANECLDVITEFADYPNAWSEAFQALGDLLAELNQREVLPEPEKP